MGHCKITCLDSAPLQPLGWEGGGAPQPPCAAGGWDCRFGCWLFHPFFWLLPHCDCLFQSSFWLVGGCVAPGGFWGPGAPPHPVLGGAEESGAPPHDFPSWLTRTSHLFRGSPGCWGCWPHPPAAADCCWTTWSGCLAGQPWKWSHNQKMNQHIGTITLKTAKIPVPERAPGPVLFAKETKLVPRQEKRKQLKTYLLWLFVLFSLIFAARCFWSTVTPTRHISHPLFF